MTSNLATSLHFSPLIDPLWLWVIAACGLILIALSAFHYRRGLFIRVGLFTLFMLALLSPSILQEERNYTKDVATLIIDESHSQKYGERTQRTQAAAAYIQTEIEKSDMFDLRIIRAPKSGITNQTELFGALEQSLADVPEQRRAGVIIISDGQIHDIPSVQDDAPYGPVHLLLSGNKNEKDRRITITNAPAYGLVGKPLTVKYRVEDSANIKASEARVTLTHHDGRKEVFYAPLNTEQTISVDINNPSQNIFSLSVEPVDGEISLANNKTPLIINGVRDRLKVMLISGVPHPGERTWRDLLTSDPGIDLVHFTILREPQKFDITPKNEMALIAFPFRELFDIKLYDFDLIIFDRYRIHNILRDHYFENIVKFVQDGGAFLAATGPDFAGNRSIYNTPLKQILPAAPSGNVIEEQYTPTLTALGKQHPVTQNLSGITTDGTPDWGPWLRQIDVTPHRGDVVMNGVNDKPLIILDRVGQGRVAQIASDHIWLWSRDYKGGGPHAELLRKSVHWLMKEPELDERALNVQVNGNQIKITKHAYTQTQETLALTRPNGEIETLDLNFDPDAQTLSATITADELGIYAFEDTAGMRKFGIVGDIDPPELRALLSSAEPLEPLITASQGTHIWLSETSTPQVHAIKSSARRFGGGDWVGLKQNNAFTVTGVKDTPLLPNWLTLLILISALISGWWLEGKARLR